MKQAYLGLFLALGLAACGQKAAPTVPVGAEASAAIRQMLPSNLPAYAPIFPGALIRSAQGYANGGVITYIAPATSDQVAGFYSAAATAAQLTPSLDTASWHSINPFNAPPKPGPRVLVYAQQGTSRSLYVTIGDLNGFSDVSVVYGAR